MSVVTPTLVVVVQVTNPTASVSSRKISFSHNAIVELRGLSLKQCSCELINVPIQTVKKNVLHESYTIYHVIAVNGSSQTDSHVMQKNVIGGKSNLLHSNNLT